VRTICSTRSCPPDTCCAATFRAERTHSRAIWPKSRLRDLARGQNSRDRFVRRDPVRLTPAARPHFVPNARIRGRSGRNPGCGTSRPARTHAIVLFDAILSA
jgi:hypothetical protein